MTATTKILKTIEHESREANLQAAKQAVRKQRAAYMQRRTDLTFDIIDIVFDGDVLERHICKIFKPYPNIKERGSFSIEELALYQ